MNYILLTISIAVYLIGIISIAYNVNKIVIIDAKARKIKKPKLMGLLAISGRNSEGLLYYLLYRRKYPIINMLNSDKLEIERRKKIILVGIIFMVIGAIGFVFNIYKV